MTTSIRRQLTFVLAVMARSGVAPPGYRTRTVAATLTLTALVAMTGVTAAEAHPRERTRVTELATFVNGPCADDICSTGSTVGPGGDLYVTDSTAGRIQRVDPRRGTVTTFADGLPRAIPGVVGGGLADIAFRGHTAYVLVTGVSEFWTDLIGSSAAPAAEGIYRLDRVGRGTTRATLIADIYTWSEANPPRHPEFFVPGGFTYAMQPDRHGFLVTDAHHNRVLRVRLNGDISVVRDFAADVVPTGLDTLGSGVLVGQAGPVPHIPSAGRVVALGRPGGPIPVASGAPLLVDVEARGHTVYGLAQGDWPYEGESGKEGFPASPNTGLLMRADRLGQFQPVVSGLDRPTTFEIIGDTAFVVTITGKVLRVSGLDGGHHGR